LRFDTQSLQQRQPPTDPTLVLAQQRRRLHLRQPVFANQRLHEPRFLQLARLLTRSIESEDGRLRTTLVGVDQPHAQRRPADRRGRRVTLETVEQLGAIVPPTRRDRRQLAVTRQRPRHRLLRSRIGQPVAAVGHAQLRHGQRHHLGVRPATHDAPSTPPPRTGRNGRNRKHRNPPALRRLGGYVRSSRDLGRRTTGKDIMAAAPRPAAIVAAEGDTPPDAAADTALRDPARCATPGDNGSNRIAAATTPSPPRTARNNPAADTSVAKNPHSLTLGAGPRAARRPVMAMGSAVKTRSAAELLPRPPAREVRAAPPVTVVRAAPPVTVARPTWAAESDDDNAAIVPAGNAGPPHSNATSGSPDDGANVPPSGNTMRCNNDSADGSDERTARTP